MVRVSKEREIPCTVARNLPLAGPSQANIYLLVYNAALVLGW